MDENLPNVKTEMPNQATMAASGKKTEHGQRNLLLAISAIVVGGAIVIGVFNASFPSTISNDSAVSTSKQTTVTDVNNVSSLDSVDKELDTTSLDDYQNELNQNNADAASF